MSLTIEKLKEFVSGDTVATGARRANRWGKTGFSRDQGNWRDAGVGTSYEVSKFVCKKCCGAVS